MKKIFLCWSGDRSKEVARILKNSIGQIITGTEAVWSEDIPSGKEWFPAIIEKTRSCEAAVICFTPENLDSPWMHFEAGAILNSIAARASAGHGQEGTSGIFLFLFGACEAVGPFSQLQASSATDRESVQRFFAELTRFLMGENSIQAATNKFTERWPALLEEFESLLRWELPCFYPEFENLFARKTFNESFADCVDRNWRERYKAIVETLATLKCQQQRVKASLECSSFHQRLYDRLLGSLDRYAMVVGGLLLKENDFSALAGEDRERCDSMRKEVRRVAGLLARKYQPPVFPEAIDFELSDTHAERKALIQQFELRLRQGTISPQQIAGTRQSLDWALDRIVSYLAYSKASDNGGRVSDLLDGIRFESGRANSQDLISGLEPLYYALEALDDNFPEPAPEAKVKQRILRQVEMVCEFLDRDARRDAGQHVRKRLTSLLAKIKSE